MEAAFNLGAGFSANELNILIRGMIASLITIWGAWIMWKQFQMVGDSRMKIGEWGVNVAKMIFLVTFVLIIVGL
ncbi:MAG: TIGR03758 family integrating conjugative element protein [Gammaproteobacteria bacterium]|nr:TIGR03758 family integrating conjugative element protein [Gammaproteobacteria bacterium]